MHSYDLSLMETTLTKSALSKYRRLAPSYVWWFSEHHIVKPMATILIIDDNAAIRSTLCTALRHAGYTVLVAATGVDGLEHCREHPVDLVLTDILMPGTDGLTVIAILKCGRPNTKIIAMTGVSGEKNLLDAAKVLGAHAVMRKPVDLPSLREMVKKELGESPHAMN
jgi:CheY-like chemotaxis protein